MLFSDVSFGFLDGVMPIEAPPPHSLWTSGCRCSPLYSKLPHTCGGEYSMCHFVSLFKLGSQVRVAWFTSNFFFSSFLLNVSQRGC
jgi:hypothetical protein